MRWFSGDVTGDYEILPLYPQAGQAAQEEFGLPLMLEQNMHIAICVLKLDISSTVRYITCKVKVCVSTDSNTWLSVFCASWLFFWLMVAMMSYTYNLNKPPRKRSTGVRGLIEASEA